LLYISVIIEDYAWITFRGVRDGNVTHFGCSMRNGNNPNANTASAGEFLIMQVNEKYISVKFNPSRLRERNKQLSFLLDLSNLLSTSPNIKKVLTNALVRILEYFDYDAGRIYLLEDQNRRLKLTASYGVDPASFAELQIEDGFSGKAARTKSFIAQYITDLGDKKRVEFLTEHGFVIIVCVPLIVRNQIVGVMNLSAKKAIELDEHKIDLLMAIGNYIAVYLNQAMLYDELNDKIKELEKKNETIKIFSYSISHDLKGPTIGIHGIINLFIQKYQNSLDDRGKEYCNQILKTAERLSELVGSINRYINAKESPLQIVDVSLNEITEELKEEFAVALNERKVILSEPAESHHIRADKLAITRVLQNLIDNALKYGGKDLTEITIGYDQDEAYNIISVSDDGVPISPEEADRLFNVFERLSKPGKAEGSGLGLTIVKEIAEKHKGRAWLESNTGRGKTFYVAISREL
jgi:signal transduction histidine kinase